MVVSHGWYQCFSLMALDCVLSYSRDASQQGVYIYLQMFFVTHRSKVSIFTVYQNASLDSSKSVLLGLLPPHFALACCAAASV